MEFEVEQLVGAAENIGINYQSYSGRGMYGDKCFAITCDDENPFDIVLDLLINLVADIEPEIDDVEVSIVELLDDAKHFLRNPRTDSLGLGCIIYWPHIEFND